MDGGPMSAPFHKRANGEGSIWKRKDGRWCASIVWDGERKYFYAASRMDVTIRLNKALEQRAAGLAAATTSTTIAEFFRQWIDDIKPTIRYSTWFRYKRLLELHALPHIGVITLAELRPQHLQRLYAKSLEDGMSPTSVHHLHAVLHKLLGAAQRWDIVARNIADLVDAPRIRRKEVVTLSQVEVRRLLSSVAEPRLRAFLTLAVTTGMRQGELLGLNWSDVSFENRTIAVRSNRAYTESGYAISQVKTMHSRRLVQLSDSALRALSSHQQKQHEQSLLLGDAWTDSGLVFTNDHGGLWNHVNVRHAFERVLREATLPRIRIHDLRHTAATLLLERGVHPKIVSEMLGHSTIAITLDTYSHVTTSLQQAAAHMMDEIING